jgi:hypothetical protein
MADTQNTEAGKTGWPVIRETITNRNILIYVLSLGASKTGFWGKKIAVGWLTWELTKDPAWLGIVAFAEIAPALFLVPFGGVVADRIGLLRTLRLTLVLQVLITLVLFSLVSLGVIDVNLLLLLVFSSSCVAALGWSSEYALIGVLASDRHLVAGVVLQNLMKNVSRLGGPLLAGLMIAFSGVGGSILVAVGGYAIFFLGLSLISNAAPLPAAQSGAMRKPFSQIGEVFKFIFRNRAVMLLFGCLLLSFFGVSGVAGKKILEQLMQASAGMQGPDMVFGLAGLVGMAIIVPIAIIIPIAMRGSIRNLTRYVGYGILSGAIAMMYLAFVPSNIALVVIGLVFFVSAETVISTGARVLALRTFPREMLGRGMAIYIVVGFFGPALIVLLIGMLADFVPLSGVIGGAASLLICFWLWLRPRIPDMAAVLESPRLNDWNTA